MKETTGQPQRVLVICTGNICRSAVAGLLLTRTATELGLDLAVRSRGVSAAVGRCAPSETKAAAKLVGVDLDDHRGCQLQADDVIWADEVLVMEPWQSEAVLSLEPTARVFCLATWHPRAGGLIPDPFGGGEEVHRQAVETIALALTNWFAQRFPR